MKYPNDFVRERNGYAPGSQGDRSALARVGAPFLTKESKGSRTYKKDGFYEVEVTEGEPSLIGYYKLNNGQVWPALIDIDTGDETRRVSALTPFYKLGPQSADSTHARLPYVGDGYVLALFSNINDIGTGTEAVTHWPVMVRAEAWAQYLASDVNKTHKTTTFIDEIQINGLLTELHAFWFTCSGWGDTTKRFRFGLALTYYTDPTNSATRNATRAPVFFAGDTGTQSMTQKAVPYYSGRNNIAFTPFVVGPGKLRALQVVEEDETLVQPKLAPYLAESTNHGDTWSSAAAAFLTPYLYEHPASGPDRAYYENLQLAGLAFSSVIVYLGQGKSMLIIPNGYDSGAAKYFPMAFLDTGSGYARVAWPPDAWEVSSNGSSLGASYLRFFGYTNDLKSCQFGFGDGCMYMPVRSAGENKLLFTRNYGASWQFSAALPGLMGTNNFTNFGTVMSPYVDATKKGRLIFAQPDYATERVHFHTSDGDFSAFRRGLGTLATKGGGGLDEAATPDFNVFFTNFVGTPWPAFPTEFIP